jgi:hypothetical protein
MGQVVPRLWPLLRSADPWTALAAAGVSIHQGPSAPPPPVRDDNNGGDERPQPKSPEPGFGQGGRLSADGAQWPRGRARKGSITAVSDALMSLPDNNTACCQPPRYRVRAYRISAALTTAHAPIRGTGEPGPARLSLDVALLDQDPVGWRLRRIRPPGARTIWQEHSRRASGLLFIRKDENRQRRRGLVWSAIARAPKLERASTLLNYSRSGRTRAC